MKSRRLYAAKGRSKTGLYAAIIIILMPIFILLQSVWISKNDHLFGKGMILKLQTRQVECDTCGAIGLIRNRKDPTRSEVCPICFGVGRHAVRQFDREEVLCPLCGGMGRVQDEPSGYAQDCPRCGGRGIIRRDESLSNRFPPSASP